MRLLKRLLSTVATLSLNREVLAKCGHKTKLRGTVTAFGERTTMRMPTNAEGTTDYCLECIGKMTIRCAWCGGLIFIGDPITLCTPHSEEAFLRSAEGQREFEFVFDGELGFKIPAYAVVYRRKPLQLVGCLRWECAESGADRAGYWVPGPDGAGMVYRVQTAYEEILSGAAGKTTSVVVGDLHDPNEAHPLKEEGGIIITRIIE